MMLLDTSIWIELFSKKNPYSISPDQLLRVIVCPTVIQEILQGIRDDAHYALTKAALLAFPCAGNPVLLEDYFLAGDIYRTGREKGYTIRSSTDCLIAALAIRAKVPVCHKDRDFDFIAKFTSLKIVSL